MHAFLELFVELAPLFANMILKNFSNDRGMYAVGMNTHSKMCLCKFKSREDSLVHK